MNQPHELLGHGLQASEDLRSFLQLAFLTPGVAISANYQGDYNRAMDVSILGGVPSANAVMIAAAYAADPVDSANT